ncbi:MAG: hypothetical protein ACERKN_02835 [Velocimicrobium sp.]
MEYYEEINALIQEKKYSTADKKMDDLLSTITPLYQKQLGKYYSFNHVLEVYYYDYFLNHDASILHTDINLSAYYRLHGFIKMQLDDFKSAAKSYETALVWNPVDLDSLLQLGELYKRLGNLKDCRRVSESAYNFCCTRATLARYYRNLGFFYLESYQPDIATALYQYSNIYYPSTQADNELIYLEKALNRPTPTLSLNEIQQILSNESIPTGPNPDTIGITYRVGQLELEGGNIENAKDCFTMVYDLTQDVQIKTILDQL